MARRARKDDATDETEQPKRKRKISAPPSNVTDETIREYCGKALAEKTNLEAKEFEAKSAKGAYRAVLKAAKSVGIDPDHIRWWLDARKQDVKEIDRATTWRNRVARIMGLPIGTQLGLFDDGLTVAAAVDADKIEAAQSGIITPSMLAAAEDAGVLAGKAGKGADQGPYNDPAAPVAIRWEKGRQLGQAELAGRFEPAETEPELAG